MTDFGPYGLGIDHAGDVAVTGNRVVGTDDDLSGFGWRVDSDAVSTDGNSLVVAGADRPARLDSLDEG